ncbi:MAG: FtsX-like permease family protein [Bacteroidales bacterium]|nr:FtsX-like permease family protein [Bacteroidales bacterium]
MRISLFISRRLIRERDRENSFSRPVNVIAIAGISMGLAVMILAVSILTGFKEDIRDKIAGFAGHLQIINLDSNYSYETAPINTDQDFIGTLRETRGINHIQQFATKAGIIKTDENIQGVVLKGVGPDYDWSFFEKSLVEGNIPAIGDSVRSDGVVISKKISDMLGLSTGDPFAMFFVQDPPRQRRFTVEGIYETSVEEMDKIFVLCDIDHIRRLNGWSETQASGFEILVDDFSRIDEMTMVTRSIIGYPAEPEMDKLKVTNIRIKYPQIFDWLNFQDTNVIVILILMLTVAGFNMISGLLILILEKTNMIGVLKALGSGNRMIRRIFLWQASYLIFKGLLWGNLTGITLAWLQERFSLISLDPSSYYLSTVPVNLELFHVLILNAGTMAIIILMMLIPSHLVSRISPVKAIRFD